MSTSPFLFCLTTPTLFVASVALSMGCSGDLPAIPSSFGRVQLAALGGSDHDVTQFEIRLIEDGSGSCETGTLVAAQSVVLEEESLPPWIGEGADHHFADGLFVVPVDTYLVCAIPQRADGSPSNECQPATATVVALDGETVEVVLVSNCVGDDNAGIDVVAMLNDPPTFDDLVVSPSKFIKTCEQADITVSASDIDGDTVSYSWAVTASPTGSMPVLTASAASASFSTDLPGDYEVAIQASDSHGAVSELSFPIHVQDLPCTSEAFWLASAAGTGNDFVHSIHVDDDGNVYFTGSFSSPTIDFGLGPHTLTTPAFGDAYVVKLDPDGVPLWSKTFGSINSDAGVFIGEHNGELILVGNYRQELDLGCPVPLPDPILTDAFVAKLDPANGDCRTQARFGGDSHDVVQDAAIDSQGDVILVGHFDRDMTEPPLTHPGADGADAFYFKLRNSDLAPVWWKAAGGDDVDRATAIAVGPLGAIVITGTFASPTMTFDGVLDGTLSAAPNGGGEDPFVGRLISSSGNMLWVESSPTPGDAVAHDVAIDSTGTIAFAGAFDGSLDFGTPLTGPAIGSGQRHAFIALFDAASTHLRTDHGVGDNVASTTIQFDADGNLRYTGTAEPSANFGHGPLLGTFVGSLSPTGGDLWSVAAQDAGGFFASFPEAIAIDPAGNTIVGGSFGLMPGDTFSIGGAPSLVNTGAYDIWLGKIAN